MGGGGVSTYIYIYIIISVAFAYVYIYVYIHTVFIKGRGAQVDFNAWRMQGQSFFKRAWSAKELTRSLTPRSPTAESSVNSQT